MPSYPNLYLNNSLNEYLCLFQSVPAHLADSHFLTVDHLGVDFPLVYHFFRNQ